MRKNKVLTAFFVIGCIAVVGIAGIVTLFAKDNFGNKNLICDGISIGSLDVGGLTQEQAQKKVDDYIAKRRAAEAGCDSTGESDRSHSRRGRS